MGPVRCCLPDQRVTPEEQAWENLILPSLWKRWRELEVDALFRACLGIKRKGKGVWELGALKLILPYVVEGKESLCRLTAVPAAEAYGYFPAGGQVAGGVGWLREPEGQEFGPKLYLRVAEALCERGIRPSAIDGPFLVRGLYDLGRLPPGLCFEVAVYPDKVATFCFKGNSLWDSWRRVMFGQTDFGPPDEAVFWESAR